MLPWILIFLLPSLPGPADPGPEVHFRRVPIAPESVFEAAGTGDFDRDGTLDIMCGNRWYRGPDWTPQEVCEIRDAGGYRVDFANVTMDVDGDGWLDVVSCSWHDRAVTWRRNPGPLRGPWKELRAHQPGPMETGLCVDVDRDGKVDFLPSLARGTSWYTRSEGTLVGRKLEPSIDGHGVGFGDVNGDGRGDILKPTGWFEAPEDPRKEPWIWHPEWKLGAPGIGILAHDFTGDGHADIVWGMGHDYGVFWMEQTRDGEKRAWTRHEIDKSWSQAHALRLADFDGDGHPEVLTGKRRHAHNGKDPGAEDPQIIVRYSFDRKAKKFHRQVIHRGDGDGLGLAPVIIDIDGDGDLDFVAPGKGGLYLYLQEPRKS